MLILAVKKMLKMTYLIKYETPTIVASALEIHTGFGIDAMMIHVDKKCLNTKKSFQSPTLLFFACDKKISCSPKNVNTFENHWNAGVAKIDSNNRNLILYRDFFILIFVGRPK